jgi:hypothetical protein
MNHVPTLPPPIVRPAPVHRGRSRVPEQVQVLIGGRWLPARAHSARFTRRGPQTLIDCNGRLFWVNSARVRHPQSSVET